MAQRGTSWLDRINRQMTVHRHRHRADELERRVAEEPGNPQWHLELGEAYWKLGQSAEAIRTLYQAAHLYGRQGLVRRASAVLSQITELRSQARGPGIAHVSLRQPNE